jgi:hypothetical protein
LPENRRSSRVPKTKVCSLSKQPSADSLDTLLAPHDLAETEFTHILGTFPLVIHSVKAAALDAFRANESVTQYVTLEKPLNCASMRNLTGDKFLPSGSN